MKDPRQILESFRTDVHSQNIYSSLLRQFDLEYPNSRGNRRKPQKSLGKNMNQMAAALSVCLVTGLTAGVGSAFANNEIGPVQPPLDEAPSKANQKIEQLQTHGKELERQLSEHPVDLEKKERAESGTEEQLQKDQQQTEAKEIPPIQNFPQDIEKITIQEQHETEKKSAQTEENKPVEKFHAGEESGHRKELNAQQQEESVQEKSKEFEVTKDRVAAAEKEVSPKTANPVESSADANETAKANDRQDSNTQQVPQTVQGGALPDTAGDDLNGVLLGGTVALLGSVYTLRKNKAESS
ncbi:MAG: hypothetical protein WB502_12560 [Thermoactinomyces sp.]